MDPSRLKSIPLFSNLNDKQLKRIAQLADDVDLPAGTHLTDQGKFSYEFMIIEDGSADVLVDGSKIATLATGDFFGEIGLLEHSRRTATVVASTSMRLAVIATREFMTLADEMPDVKEQVAKAAAERMAELQMSK